MDWNFLSDKNQLLLLHSRFSIMPLSKVFHFPLYGLVYLYRNIDDAAFFKFQTAARQSGTCNDIRLILFIDKQTPTDCVQ